MRKFKAFSLIEMLITLGIMSIVVLIATQTLNTVFRVSTISKFKTVTRNEMSFSMELVERLLANSNVKDVYIYNPTPSDGSTEPVRYYNEDTNKIVDKALGDTYTGEMEIGDSGTEIHIRPYGYDMWVCIGFFMGEDTDGVATGKGYLLKRTLDQLDGENTNHASCFSSTYNSTEDPILVLNSEDVNVNGFLVSYVKSTDINNVFYIDMEMEPTSWVPGESAIERAVIRQAIVTTKGLTWY